MAIRTTPLTDALYSYMFENSIRETPDMRALREETLKLPNGYMASSPEQAQFFQLLIRLMRARNAIEIGVFTGYTTMAIALALPDDGRIIACDNNPEYTDIAMKYWLKAGVGQKILLKTSPALVTLDCLLAENRAESFDFIFIDADKNEYLDYFERSLKLIRPGGLIAIDNVFRGGKVLDDQETDSGTIAVRALNARLADDPRIFISMLPIGDGLTLALKK